MPQPTDLLKKLQIKSGARLWLVNVPREIAEELTAGAEVEPVRAGEDFDGAIAFCETIAELESFSAQILKRLPEDGLLWFAYRKGEAAAESGFNRDKEWESVYARSLRPVRQIAFDHTWSGVRFRPAAKVKAKEGSRFSPAG
ncbi:hypothetical protein [Devosia geojensis]|uniref:hypothetical protein n=1 Tax=Devosia geojensis TaxID=443610 RepID=UPI00069663E3|nr:hypothetical protein [Devosia geojensis]